MENDDVFRAETDHGHAFKIFIEMLHGLGFTRCMFTLSRKGIVSKQMDQGKKYFFDLHLDSQKFKLFKYDLPEPETHVQFNVTAYKKQIVSVKKKDYILFYIKDTKGITELGITIKPKNITNGLLRSDDGGVPITKCDKVEVIDTPSETYMDDGQEVKTYENPVVFDTIDMQRIKKPTNTASEKTGVKVIIQPTYYLEIFGTNGLERNRAVFGEYNKDLPTYERYFEPCIFAQLSKASGFGGLTRFYVANLSDEKLRSFPLKIVIDVGRIGTFLMYIKDMAQIEEERKERLTENIQPNETPKKKRASKRKK